MTSNQPLKIFDAFDIQFRRTEIDRQHIKTIDYCVSRFRTVLGFFSHASFGQQMAL